MTSRKISKRMCWEECWPKTVLAVHSMTSSLTIPVRLDNIDSEHYLRLSRMGAKQLEKALIDIDFENRYEDKLKVYIDQSLVPSIQSRLEDCSGSKLVKAITELHDYFKRTIKFFAPFVVSQERVDESTRDGTKPRKEPDFKDKIFTDFKNTLTNHIKYCVMDTLDYDSLFMDFIQ